MIKWQKKPAVKKKREIDTVFSNLSKRRWRSVLRKKGWDWATDWPQKDLRRPGVKVPL